MAEDRAMPPEGKLVYRLLTGKDDDAFCRRISEALAIGYTLYGSPSISFNGEHPIVAQAVLWSGQRKAATGE